MAQCDRGYSFVCVCVCVLCCFVLCIRKMWKTGITRNSSAVCRGFCLLFATCNSNAWKALFHHQTHTLTRQSAELYSKGSNYITQPNNELIIEDGGHLAFDQGLRDRLWAGEGRRGGDKRVFPFLSKPTPSPSPVEPPPSLLWPNLVPNNVTFTRSPGEEAASICHWTHGEIIFAWSSIHFPFCLPCFQ